MGSIFISYRREDTAGHAGRLFDRLAEHFGRDHVFMDVSDIEPGVDFVEAIEHAVGSCEVLVVVIGRDWLKATDASGKRRLDDPRDFIRLEVGAALKRDIRVIPALVRGASVPALETLPGDLEKLARRNAVELSDNRWDSDVREFIKLLDNAISKKPRVPNKAWWPAATAVSVALITVAAAYFTWPLVRGLTQGAPSAPSATSPPAKIDASTSSKPEVAQPGVTKRPVRLPAETAVNVADLNYKIVSAELDSHAGEKLALTFLVRMTNNRNYPRNFWDNSFRLEIDHVPQAPVGGLNEVVAGKSAKEGRVVFVIAGKTTRAKLRIESEGENAEIPLELGAESSIATASPAPQPVAPAAPQPVAPSVPEKKPETIAVKTVPGPALVSPTHNAMLDNGCKDQPDSTAWDFSWAKVAGASRYHLHVAAPNAKNPAVSQPDLSTTSYRHEQPGPSHVTDRARKGWHWKVRAHVGDEWSEWSKTRTFDVEPLDTDCKTATIAETGALAKPSQPLPVAPIVPETLPPAEVKSAAPQAKAASEAVRPPPDRTKDPERAAPAPEKIAAAPPSTSRPGMPKIGDTWTYRYTSGWRGEKEKTYQHKIVGIDPIKETMSVAGADSETHTFNDAVELVNRRVSNAMRQEFSPFLQAFTALEAGKSWKNIPAPQDDAIVYPWSVQAKVVGPEPVSVPAGKFDAIKVELFGNRTADVSRAQAGSVAVRSKQVIWYSPEVKRVVKHTRNTFAPNGNDLDKDTYELVEYKLN